MYRHCRSIIILFLIIILTGCRDQMEIDRITFPIAMGIDWDEANHLIKVYAQVSDTSSQGNGQGQGQLTKTYKVLEGQGYTLLKAMTEITDHVGQFISWKQLSVVIFTSKMAQHGISDELDHLSRFEQIHISSYLLVTRENLKDLLESKPDVATGLPAPLAGIRLISAQNTHTKVVTIRDYIMAYLSDGIEPVLPMVSLYNKESKEFELDYNGLGVMKKGRLAGWLDEEETRGLLSISGMKNIGSIIIPVSENNEDKTVTLTSLSTDPRIIPGMVQNKPNITVKICAEYNITETSFPIKFDHQMVNRINIQVQKFLKNEIESVIRKAQKDLAADVFGFGEKIHRKYPKYWLKNKNHWPEIFPDIDVYVEVEAHLRNTGELGSNLKHSIRED